MVGEHLFQSLTAQSTQEAAGKVKSPPVLSGTGKGLHEWSTVPDEHVPEWSFQPRARVARQASDLAVEGFLRVERFEHVRVPPVF